MPSPTALHAVSDVNKSEACKILGRSRRMIDGYIASGKLTAFYISGKFGREVRFKREDVQRLKSDLENPIPRDAPPPSALSAVPAIARGPAPDAIAQLAAAIRTAQPAALPPTLTPHMSLSEAVEYSGLPAAFLVAEARAGRIRAVNVGTKEKEFWRFAKEAV